MGKYRTMREIRAASIPDPHTIKLAVDGATWDALAAIATVEKTSVAEVVRDAIRAAIEAALADVGDDAQAR